MYKQNRWFCGHKSGTIRQNSMICGKTLSMYLCNESTNGVKGHWSKRERAGGRIEKSLPCPIYVHR